ncbi:glucose 1-dehydrogenase [Nocardia transvalensis]|uniref:glucose 1-dehydrogenase n=1 Tax=Nocardia transvalensis TaxID=37333 RepID=UPI0018942DCA|nr:glucose 1-dehydrogenase [Nocardia transvalensis]MBF6327934.1 glucose 1-dehydrogenase [Nocardia transvalensis]
MPGRRLAYPERRQITAGLAAGLTFAEIARRLERPTSTITREVMRNGGPASYRAEPAQRATQQRARRRPPASQLPPTAAESPRDSEVIDVLSDKLIMLFERMGLPRMACRVFARMFLSEADSFTAAELVAELRVSPASISKAVGYLTEVALVRRERDGRRERYSIGPDVWARTAVVSAEMNRITGETARRGAELLGTDSRAGARLADMAWCFEAIFHYDAHGAERLVGPEQFVAGTGSPLVLLPRMRNPAVPQALSGRQEHGDGGTSGCDRGTVGIVGAMSLQGRVALVTGAGRGIGRAIALALAEDGADVAVNYRADADAAAQVAAAIAAQGRRAIAVQASVDSIEDDERMVARVLEEFGHVDILVNNAGIASRGRFVADTDPAELQRVVATHALGAHHVSRLVLPSMRTRPRGDIVMVSSVATADYGAGGAPYAMGKAALEALAFTLANEERRNGIRVNVVAPGLVDTEMGRRLVKAVADLDDIHRLDGAAPFGRVCRPEDVANMVRFLVSDRAEYISGQKVYVDGGGLTLG